jgi:hypothetical protein
LESPCSFQLWQAIGSTAGWALDFWVWPDWYWALSSGCRGWSNSAGGGNRDRTESAGTGLDPLRNRRLGSRARRDEWTGNRDTGEDTAYRRGDRLRSDDLSGRWRRGLGRRPLAEAAQHQPGALHHPADEGLGGDAAEARNAFATPGKILSTDSGRFLWTRRENGFCFSMDAVERSRVILETPFLSARFTNVKYTPLIQTKSGYTTDTSRFYNGGSTSIPAPSFYAPTVYSN